MYTIYALKSEKDGRIYVGFTSELQRRFREHNLGYVFSTKGYRLWIIIYTEVVENRKSARAREKYWKSGIGKERLKLMSSPIAQR